MVEENEIRLGLSQYERARVAARAVARGVFDDEEAALRALFASAPRARSARGSAPSSRSTTASTHALRFPAAIPERLGLALVERLREGRGAAIAEALAAAAPETAEAELGAARPPRPPANRRRGAAPAPRELAPGLALATRLSGRRLTLTLQGRAVDPDLAARVEAAIAAALAPEVAD